MDVDLHQCVGNKLQNDTCMKWHIMCLALQLRTHESCIHTRHQNNSPAVKALIPMFFIWQKIFKWTQSAMNVMSQHDQPQNTNICLIASLSLVSFDRCETGEKHAILKSWGPNITGTILTFYCMDKNISFKETIIYMFIKQRLGLGLVCNDYYCFFVFFLKKEHKKIKIILNEKHRLGAKVLFIFYVYYGYYRLLHYIYWIILHYLQ